MTDAVDRATSNIQRSNAAALRAHSERKKEQQLIIDGAVACLDCHVAVDAKRLEVYPHATRCIDCQELHERLLSRGQSARGNR